MFGSSAFGQLPWGTVSILALPGIPGSPNVTRLAIEVITSNDFTIPATNTNITRAVLEVIGTANTLVGKYTDIRRLVAEVITGASAAHRSFSVQPTPMRVGSMFLVLSLADFGPGGTFSMHDIAGRGLTLRGTSSSITCTWSDGAASVTGSFSTPVGAFLLALNLGANPAGASLEVAGSPVSLTPVGSTWATVQIEELGGDRPLGSDHGAQLAELMLWENGLTAPRRTYIGQYLTCKWLNPSCNPNTDLPPAP